MQKKNTGKKAAGPKTARSKTITKPTNRKKPRSAPKKRVITKQREKETILTRIKDVFEETAAKIKAVLPDQHGSEIKSTSSETKRSGSGF